MTTPNAIPIPDNIRLEIESRTTADHKVSLTEYLETFYNWLNSSKWNNIVGLHLYNHKSFIYGTTQGFDHFYIKHRNKRFRFFKGEFMYHRASAKLGLSWCYLNDDYIKQNDAVIISVPFSDSGTIHPDLDRILNICDCLAVPVLIDLAYYPLCKNLKVNLDHICIETVCASLSKVFDGAQYLRAGIRLQKENIDDGVDIANSVGMVPHNTLATACYLMNKYTVDYNMAKYQTHYLNVCKDLNLRTTNCIMFGISDTEYKEYNRGNTWNRVCVSEDIGKQYASMQS